jgi:dTDP-4-dehydrorhamnose 3,5-epimerase
MCTRNAGGSAKGRSTLTEIHGVEVIPLRPIADERGAVYHMLRSDDRHFRGFGEIYFSSVYPGVVKGWKNHTSLTANYACVHGRIKIVIYDDRAESPTRGGLQEVVVGPDEYALVVIPPGIWHGFQGLGDPVSVLANCSTEPHDPEELERLDPQSETIPYNWGPGS